VQKARELRVESWSVESTGVEMNVVPSPVMRWSPPSLLNISSESRRGRMRETTLPVVPTRKRLTGGTCSGCWYLLQKVGEVAVRQQRHAADRSGANFVENCVPGPEVAVPAFGVPLARTTVIGPSSAPASGTSINPGASAGPDT
jgi:hypothetical protein